MQMDPNQMFDPSQMMNFCDPNMMMNCMGFDPSMQCDPSQMQCDPNQMMMMQNNMCQMQMQQQEAMQMQ